MKVLDSIFNELKRKKYDAYYVSISNENLYEFTDDSENIVRQITGFTGDTGSLLILKDKAILYVDGRFTIQARREIKDKRIKIVEVDRTNEKVNDVCERLNKSAKFAINPKIESISQILKLEETLTKKNIKILLGNGFKIPVEAYKRDNNQISLFKLSSENVSKTPKKKISELIDAIIEKGFRYYITSSLEEVAYLTNLRNDIKKIGNDKVLFDAFMIVGVTKTILYTNVKIDKKIVGYLKKNAISIKAYDEFYNDLSNYKNKKYCLDEKLNNYYVYKKLSIKNKKHFVVSPLCIPMSIKGAKEIRGLKKCNVIDGVAITKAIYHVKSLVRSAYKLSEYEIKNIVDDYRKSVGKDNYLSPSFSTIVAYKENSAICHYSPDKLKSRIVNANSILLIDSGGNYYSGTTDITRTFSLYKKKVPSIIKKHYTLVLNSLMKLASQKFPYGLTGTELDIISRQNLYNEYLDFGHGTGHGIGYVSNVHEGPNRIGPGFTKDPNLNVLESGQVVSDEPGLYFENKYGIRLENDLLVSPDRENKYADFLQFETLTLCPFDRDLIDEKLLDKTIIKDLNKYNVLVYKKLSGKMNENEKKLLKRDTAPFKY